MSNKSNKIAVNVNYALPRLSETTEQFTLNNLLKPTRLDYPVTKMDYYWPIETHGGSGNDWSPTLLKKLSDQKLVEAYFIEKAGVVFAAKMLLLAESMDERELYARSVNEEMNHLEIIRLFLGDVPYIETPMFKFIQESIETGDRVCLLYCIQVLLEGFGIAHYRNLAETCLSPELKLGLEQILKDEYRHYGSGKILFRNAKITKKQKTWIADFEQRFKELVYAGS